MGAMVLDWGGHDRAIQDHSPVTVEWDGTTRVRVRLMEAARSNKPLIVYGPKGAGKTFAVARALEHLESTFTSGLPVTYLRLPRTGQGRSLYQSLLLQIRGEQAAPSRTETMLFGELAETVSEQDRVVVVDEVHRISTAAMDAIHNLVDVPHTRTTWVLLGSEETPSRLTAELWSRAAAKVQFKRLSDDLAVKVTAEMSPVFAATDPTVIRQINRTAARGEFRYWAAVLGRVHMYGDLFEGGISEGQVGLLTEDL